MTGGKVDHDRVIDGIYEGSYKSGPVKAVVKVTIQNQKISNIEIVRRRTLKGKKAEAIIPTGLLFTADLRGPKTHGLRNLHLYPVSP